MNTNESTNVPTIDGNTPMWEIAAGMQSGDPAWDVELKRYVSQRDNGDRKPPAWVATLPVEVTARPSWADRTDYATRVSDGALSIMHESAVGSVAGTDSDGVVTDGAWLYLVKEWFVADDGLEDMAPVMSVGNDLGRCFTSSQARALAAKILELADTLDA
jgi:hypothetical protein